MKKYTISTIAILLILSCFLSGCIQQNNNNNGDEDVVKLLSDNITFFENQSLLEVTGIVRNYGNTTIDICVVEVYFYDISNILLHYSNYTIYDFAPGYDYSFYVQFRSLDSPNFKDTDHYIISLIYDRDKYNK